MVLLGTIVSIVDNYRVKVRIPVIHKARGAVGSTPDWELPIASVSSEPGIGPELKVKDVVILAFEGENYSEPVVLGKLFTKTSNVGSCSSANISTLAVTGKATLSNDTTIGDVKYSEISALTGTTHNIATRFTDIESTLGDFIEHTSNDRQHVINGHLAYVSKLSITSDMYGDSTKMDSISPSEGQLFFLLEE